jgi:hypothetical protein
MKRAMRFIQRGFTMPDNQKKKRKIDLFDFILYGIIAIFIVGLFLIVNSQR